jgi:hypothetical protein
LIPEDVTRFADERVCVLQGSVWASVSGVRVEAEGLEELLAEVRELIPPEKSVVWWIDPGARPADLHERLLGFGLQEPTDRTSLLHALACTSPPPPGPGDVEVVRVETFEQFLLTVELSWEGFDTPPEKRERQRPHLRSEFDAAVRAGVPATFLALVAGRPAGTGRSVYADCGSFLIAGAVAPWARRRGVYRALVRARWEDAVARGAPALVTEAMPDTSYPILTALGFEEVCLIRRLEDAR